jgi:hypothetical protein
VVSGERMEVKVMGQLKSALQPILKDITVDWNDLNVRWKMMWISFFFFFLFSFFSSFFSEWTYY